MKKEILLFFLLLIFQGLVFSQPCLPEGITFTTQEQIDSFQINYPGCTEIEGYVQIGTESLNYSITNLDSLNVITHINGQFLIKNNVLLTNFSGLDSLKYCFDLQMSRNHSIVNLDGFNSLDSVTFILSISHFDSLEMISGFNSLDNIPDNIFINNNPNLQQITGLNSLSSAGPLYLNNNNSLTDLSGFSNLTSLYCMYLSNCNSLNDFSGFSQLDSIPEDFVIYQCNSISDFSTLQSLDFIGGQIGISENPQLESLAGLDSVDITTIHDLHIMNNPTLSECAVKSICTLLDSSSISVNIENNAPGCNSPEEVEEACWSGIEEWKNDNDRFKVYPNPVTDWLTVEHITSSNTFDIEIQNLYGQLVKEEKNIKSPHYAMDVADLKAGVYFYLIKNVNQITQRGKLIIK